MINYYDVLALPNYSSPKEIAATGKKLLEATHPFVTGKKETGQQFRLVYEAVAVLMEDDLRAEYNYTLDGAFGSGDVAAAELQPGDVYKRVMSARKEAEQLEKDFLLFSEKFLKDTGPGVKPDSEEERWKKMSFGKLGVMLTIAAMPCFFSPMAKGEGTKPLIIYAMGAAFVIGGLAALRRAFRK